MIRYSFERNGEKVKAALESHAPEGVCSITDQQYLSGDPDAYLDAYFPATGDRTDIKFPALVWIHGGGWVSGHKDDVVPYFQRIAAEGFTVVSVDYSRSPGKCYPTPIHQVNAAIAFLQENAGRFYLDPDQIVMAGDSAGAQITSQFAALLTNLSYAGQVGVIPSLKPGQLRGVILYCGIYDLPALVKQAEGSSSRILRWGTKTIVRAYTGSRDLNSPVLEEMSPIYSLTADFPPAFISGGNADPLTDEQSRPLAARLEEIGIQVSSLFYSPDYRPALGHECQFNLDTADGQDALQQSVAFLRSVSLHKD